MAKRKTRTKPTSATRKRAASEKASSYKIEKGITKPKFVSGAKTPERLALERMKVGQSFAFTNQGVVKRVKDICYRLKQETGRRYSVCKMDVGWRAFRDA